MPAGWRRCRNRDPLDAAGRVLFVEMSSAAQDEALPDPPTLAEQVQLNFQPQLCCDTGQLAALRIVPAIDHPRGERLTLAELQSRLDGRTLAGITRAALRQAMAALRGWDRLGRRIPFLSRCRSPIANWPNPISPMRSSGNWTGWIWRPSGWSLRSANPSAAMAAEFRSQRRCSALPGMAAASRWGISARAAPGLPICAALACGASVSGASSLPNATGARISST